MSGNEKRLELVDRMFRWGGYWEQVVTVDPGRGGTGWAAWKCVEYGRPRTPHDFGVIDVRDMSERNALEIVWSQLDSIIAAEHCTTLVIESTALWGGSARSQAAAATGELFITARLIGGIERIAQQRGVYYVVLPRAQDWKGQLPKRVVKARVLKKLGVKCRNHEADAVGIGLAAMGQLE